MKFQALEKIAKSIFNVEFTSSSRVISDNSFQKSLFGLISDRNLIKQLKLRPDGICVTTDINLPSKKGLFSAVLLSEFINPTCEPVPKFREIVSSEFPAPKTAHWWSPTPVYIGILFM